MKFNLLLWAFFIALQVISLPTYAKSVVFNNMTIEVNDAYIKSVDKVDELQFNNKKESSTIFFDIIRHDLRDEEALEDLRQGFLSSNEKGNDKKHKIIYNKAEKMNNQDVVHMVELIFYDKMAKNAAENGQKMEITAVRDRYTFIKPKEVYIVTLMLPVQYYERNKNDFIGMVQSVNIKEPVRKVTFKGTKYSYEVPGHYRELPPFPGGEHVYIAGNDNLITAVIVTSLKNHPEMPVNINKLSARELAKVEAAIKKNVMRDTRNGMKNWHFEYTELNGNKCLVYDFDDVTSHSKSYVFVDNGKFISFDFGYPTADEKLYAAAVQSMVNSISK